MRVKRGTTRHAKHKKIIKLAKGYQGRRKSVFKLAKQAVYKAGQHAYRDRRVKKRVFRALWIQQINSAARAMGLNYSTLMKKFADANITLDRKMLADIAENQPAVFKELVEKATK
ncbi:MAG: 50S ribosomal protein L20 [Patescibacteria group bacterium]|jgi:large subunit ribosomal protein L20